MKILHGTWIPQAGEEFIQNGAFYLWVETTERKRRKAGQHHPRQLVKADLATLLTSELGIQPPPYLKLEELISPQYFLLPRVDNQPLPSLKLSAPHRLALTGTPIENRLLDFWSIFNFLNPGYLGNQAQFRRNFELPIQKNNDPRQSATLKKLAEPFILRRVKTDQSIIKDLPEKVEQKLYCNLTKEQASLYEAVVKDVEQQLQGRREFIAKA